MQTVLTCSSAASAVKRGIRSDLRYSSSMALANSPSLLAAARRTIGVSSPHRLRNTLTLQRSQHTNEWWTLKHKKMMIFYNQTVNDGVAHSKNPRKCAYHVTFDLEHTLDAWRCTLTCSPSCESLVAIRPVVCEKKRFAQKFTDRRTDRRTPRHCISSFLEWANNKSINIFTTDNMPPV